MPTYVKVVLAIEEGYIIMKIGDRLVLLQVATLQQADGLCTCMPCSGVKSFSMMRWHSKVADSLLALDVEMA